MAVAAIGQDIEAEAVAAAMEARLRSLFEQIGTQERACLEAWAKRNKSWTVE